MERLPAGAKRLAVVVVACLALATQVLPWADVLANGGRSRRVLDAYIAAVARGDRVGGTRSGHVTQAGGHNAGGVDGHESPAAPVLDGAFKPRPGFGPRAYPAARANPQNVIMTMVAGNSPARHAVALVQSLRDVGTQADAIVVMLQQGGVGSPECHDKPWMAARNRSGVDCGGSDTVAEEIISPFYVDVLKVGGYTSWRDRATYPYESDERDTLISNSPGDTPPPPPPPLLRPATRRSTHGDARAAADAIHVAHLRRVSNVLGHVDEQDAGEPRTDRQVV